VFGGGCGFGRGLICLIQRTIFLGRGWIAKRGISTCNAMVRGARMRLEHLTLWECVGIKKNRHLAVFCLGHKKGGIPPVAPDV